MEIVSTQNTVYRDTPGMRSTIQSYHHIAYVTT